ncbi:hypothetical protein E2C01_039612 [Portunus trituberculatus]|uniref:Uncharacterized protein n=1 Tax=Portunus trituberculatus TaxID=210409 RepID=A0A5B7FK93_PORTR|nr:hypothetical protein [Portunus trituberculatus]
MCSERFFSVNSHVETQVGLQVSETTFLTLLQHLLTIWFVTSIRQSNPTGTRATSSFLLSLAPAPLKLLTVSTRGVVTVEVASVCSSRWESPGVRVNNIQVSSPQVSATRFTRDQQQQDMTVYYLIGAVLAHLEAVQNAVHFTVLETQC